MSKIFLQILYAVVKNNTLIVGPDETIATDIFAPKFKISIYNFWD